MSSPIFVVSPYPELADQATQVIDELAIDAAVALGDLQDGLNVARTALAEGAEVLVSRGGTALLLKRNLGCPVVEIGVTAYDLLRCLTALPAGFQGRVGIVGFQNVIHDAALIAQALQIDLVSMTLTEGLSVHTVLASAKAGGISLVIGDAVTVRVAREMGIPGLLITSGREAVHLAMQEAGRLLGVLRQERQRVAQLKAILDSSHDAIVAVDEQNRIQMFNRKAGELFGVAPDAVLGRPADSAPAVAFPSGDELVQGRVHQIGAMTVLVNRVPIGEGARPLGSVTTFRDVTELQRAEEKIRSELHAKGLVAKQKLAGITAVSANMRRTIELAARYAASESTVLVQGETGTGKELFAQGIHNASPRASGPFVAINCAAIPESLLESELFGYVEGAFTGASRGGRAGLFELAHRGTIFLDEIGEMPLALQSRLLRVLQEREVMRIGSDRVLPVNIRVVAATNRPLAEEVAAGRFRADLYYRLNVLTLVLPPLRERPDDLRVLLEQFLARQAAKRGHAPAQLEPELLAALPRYPWPGNVRELKSFAERVDLLAAGGRLDHGALADLLGWLAPGARPAEPVAPTATTEALSVAGTLEEITAKIIDQVLREEEGNVTRAAKRLGVDRTTIWRRLKRDIIQKS